MTRQGSARHESGSRVAVVASLTVLAAFVAPAAFAQDLDLSGIAKEDVKKEAASNSGGLLPSFGGSSSAPAVASSSSSWTAASVLDPLGLFTSAPEPEPEKVVRKSGLGTVARYQGGVASNAPRVVTTGGAWWDPLGVFYPVEESVEYENVNDFLDQPRTDP